MQASDEKCRPILLPRPATVRPRSGLLALVLRPLGSSLDIPEMEY